MTKHEAGAALFMAEAAYAQSVVMSALGDHDTCITSLEQSLEHVPTCAPAILIHLPRRRRRPRRGTHSIAAGATTILRDVGPCDPAPIEVCHGGSLASSTD